MTVKSGFFSDGSSYNQADFNAFLLDSIGSGYVLGYENELQVSPNSPANMGVFVQTGRCYVQGYYGWVTVNEALTVPAAHNTLPRIDRVVARLSVSVNQSVTFAVLTGTPAASRSAPTLTRTSETYEISLAQIAVGAGVTSITAANITDERPDATVCGVAGVKHSWSYLNNVVIDVSSMTMDAGVSDRDPVYFNGTKWVVAIKGAVGFYDEANYAVITAGYLDGFTGLTPGEIVGNRGVALTATEIIVSESPMDSNGVKHVGDITGTIHGASAGGYRLPQTGAIKIFDTVTAVQTGYGTTYSDLSPVIAPIVIFGAIVPTKIKLALTYNTGVYVEDRPYTSGGIQSIASDGITVIETVNIPSSSAPGNYTVTLNTAGVAYVRAFSHFASGGYPLGSQVTTTLLDSYIDW